MADRAPATDCEVVALHLSRGLLRSDAEWQRSYIPKDLNQASSYEGKKFFSRQNCAMQTIKSQFCPTEISMLQPLITASNGGGVNKQTLSQLLIPLNVAESDLGDMPTASPMYNALLSVMLTSHPRRCNDVILILNS